MSTPKTWLRPLTLAALLVLASACNGGSDTAEAPTPADDGAPVDEAADEPTDDPEDEAADEPTDAAEEPAEEPTEDAPAEPAASIEMAIFAGAGIHVPEYAAERFGFFEQHNLDVELTPVSGGAGVHVASLVSESIDVAANQASVVANAIGEGSEFRLFCGQVGTAWNVILTQPDSDIPSLEDVDDWTDVITSLQGHTFGLDVLGGPHESRISALLREVGLEPGTDVEFIAVGTVGEAIAALETGQVDALFGYPFITQNMVGGGTARVALDLTAAGPEPGFHTGYFATTDWLEANSDAAEAFCAAIADAIAYLQDPDNSDDLDALMLEEFGVEDEAARQEVHPPDGLIRLYETDLNCDRIDIALADAAEGGVINPGSPTTCAEVIWQ